MIPETLRRVTERLTTKFMSDVMNGKIETERIKCRYCGSETIWKYGKNRNGVQRYKCPVCDKVFLDVDALPKMRVEVRQLGDIVGQYFGGMSYKEIRRQFKQQHDIHVARSSFHRWLSKFAKIVVDEASKYHPKVSGVWLADECVLKIGGKNVWCWDIIDSDSRFLLATHLSRTRTIRDAKALVEKASKVAGRVPDVIITDSLNAYIDGIELAFGADTKHIQSKPFTSSDLSTNKIERWHSTLKMRTNIMRGLKSIPTAQALLDGWLVHYNFFRGHESLNDRTPADVAGLKFPHKDWLDVIEGQRLVIKPESVSEMSPVEQVEQYRHPTYRAQARRKIKRASGHKIETTLKGVRR